MWTKQNCSEKKKISKILIRLAPLIHALYNIVDSIFVGKYSGSGLTALSIIYPVQLLMIALAGGTGVGINTIMAAKLGTGKQSKKRMLLCCQQNKHYFKR